MANRSSPLQRSNTGEFRFMNVYYGETQGQCGIVCNRPIQELAVQLVNIDFTPDQCHFGAGVL